jgi:glycosyltransferase involved in cell wall biosynthesis
VNGAESSPPAAASPNLRVAIFLQDLAGGGAEGSMVRLANGLAASGCEVELALVRAEGSFLAAVSPAVRVVGSPKRRTLWSALWLAAYLRRTRPAALLSALPHANLVAILAARLAGHRTRIVITERTEVSKAVKDREFPLVRLAYRLIPWIYPLADEIVAVSAGVADDLRRSPRLARRVSVVHNPIIGPDLPHLAAVACDHPWLAPGQPPVLIGVGRLSPEKDFATLIRAVHLVRRRQQVRLIIVGEGNRRPELEQLRSELALDGVVDLVGWVRNPFALMSRAALLVQSSIYEGLPTVLVEAMACGTPVVATHCSSGSAEILENGRLGRLVPVADPAALAAAISAALAESPPADALRRRAADFTVERAVDGYRRILFAAAARRS